jgi:hypothetical protein
MGRLLGKEDFIDTFGLNIERPKPPKRKPRWGEEPEEYTADELKILQEFESLIQGSTLDENSDFKRKLKELADKRLRCSKPKKNK